METKLHGAEFPFLFLDPRFCWHGGFDYWEGRFRALLQVAMDKWTKSKRRSVTYYECLRMLSGRLAALELVPYHSSVFSAGRVIDVLPSSIRVRAYVNDVLVPRARAGHIVLVVLRAARRWGLMNHGKNIVCYEGGEARGAWCGPNTRGGAAILEHLMRTRRQSAEKD